MNPDDIDLIEAAIIKKRFKLKATGTGPETWHQFDSKPAYALVAALTSNRPLLIRGEPGLGKSQLAQAAAHVLKRRFISIVIQPDTEYQDLLWGIDHTQRLADAQLASVEGNADKLKDFKNYIGTGALWWALDWKDAKDQSSICSHNFCPPEDPNTPNAITAGVVLLIDEIDKADIGLSNSLLEVLGNEHFPVPPLAGKIVKAKGISPLIILTTNDTRQLPAALQRRCVVLKMSMPDDVHDYLVKLGETHHPNMDEEILNEAASQIVKDRSDCQELPKTGQAEYLDLLRALENISKSAQAQRKWLRKLGGYFQKSPID